MTALTQDLTLTGEIVTVDGPLLVGKAYHLQDEVVVVGGSVIENYSDVTTGDRWRIRRGQDHTTAATHSSGTALTLAREFESGGAGAGGVTNPVTEPLVVEGQVAETEPSVLIEMTTWEQSTETAAALIVRDMQGISRVAIADPNESALVVIDPRNSDVPLDGLRVRHGGAGGQIALYTSLGDGDVNILDRISISPSGDGTGAPTFSERPVDLIQAGPLFRILYEGAIVTGQNSAPTDADLAETQVAIWFDSTNGAAKVMFKGKTADGTVVVGEVALT